MQKSKEKEVLLGTPNPKAQYQRLGYQMEELSKQPFYKGKSAEMANIAKEMTKLYMAALEYARFEKECGRLIQVYNLENKKLSEVFDRVIEKPDNE